MRHWRTRQGFTFLELLIIVAVTGVLLSLVMPMYKAEKDRAMGNKCMDNLKQIGVAMKAYGNDWNGKFPICGEGGDGTSRPGACQLFKTLSPYIAGNNQLFCCPADTGDKVIGGNPQPYYKGVFGFWSSYAWPKGWNWVDGLPQDNPIRGSQPKNWAEALPISRRPALFDHRPWHRGNVSSNWLNVSGYSCALYCDGHVGSETHQWLIACMMATGMVEPQ